MIQLIIYDLLIILIAGLLAGAGCRRLGISMLVGYIGVGAIVGAGGFGWVTDQHHEIKYIAEAGILFLLFSIGLEFSLGELNRLRRYIFLGGSLQMLIAAIPAAVVFYLYSTDRVSAVVFGFSLAMSSTVLVFKALAEYGETSSLLGRRSIGILLFQDMAVVPLLLLVPIFMGEGHRDSLLEILILIPTTAGIIVGVLLLRAIVRRWIVPLMIRMQSPELIVLLAVTIFGSLSFGVYKLGLPPPLGAFAAGLVLSGNRLTAQVDSLILPFREVFSAVFFVSLGLLFDPEIIINNPGFVLVGFAGLLLLKFTAGTLAARTTKLNWRGACGVGVSLAQIGEFAFVLAYAAWEAGIFPEEAYQYILIFSLSSMILTPQMIKLGLRLSRSAICYETKEEIVTYYQWITEPHAIVIGIGPVGRQVTRTLGKQNIQVCAVDLSPVNLHPLAQQGYHTIAGDARDIETLKNAGIKNAHLILVCVPLDEIAQEIISSIRNLNSNCKVIVRCRYESNVEMMTKAGADVVVSEEIKAAEALLQIIGEVKQAT